MLIFVEHQRRYLTTTLICWSEESKNHVVVNKILDGLKIPENCSGIRVPILNEAAAKNIKITLFYKRADKRSSDIQKRVNFCYISSPLNT